MQKTIKLSLCISIVILVGMLTCIMAYAVGPKGKTYYTKVNIWHEPGKIILSTNFHKGIMLPVGTKVVIRQYRGTKIVFTDEKTGVGHTLIHVRKHNKIKLEELFDRYFSEESVIDKKGVFSKFTKEERKNIKDGTIATGMSKKAVLMAYGYPPSHMTQNLLVNLWTYWKSRHDKILVHFEDDKIVEIED